MCSLTCKPVRASMKVPPWRRAARIWRICSRIDADISAIAKTWDASARTSQSGQSVALAQSAAERALS